MTAILIISTIALVVLSVLVTFAAIIFRRVVPTNEVHIVQSSKVTKSFGAGLSSGNTYYEWPSWVPIIGITRITLPVSVFNLNLRAYEAYDKGRLPFVVDIVAFFRISESNVAAQRVASFAELNQQLTAIVQGAIRTILANHELEEIMTDRSKFGEQFTKEVASQLKEWGVIAVKNIELMDIRDAQGNQVIHNIMEKKKSLIEMQSRIEVANNMKSAEVSEIQAKRDTEVEKQSAIQSIGQRTAETEKAVGVAKQVASQEIKEQERVTKEKEMAVVRVAEVKKAEIMKESQIVAAAQDKETTILIAEGTLASKKLESEGIQVEGAARAEAEKAMQLAPVEAQIVLAKEIGENASYQQYLLGTEQIKANQIVGVAQAQALKEADVKVISNTGDVSGGVNSVMDLFTSKGGTALAGMVEGFAQSPTGKAMLEKVTTKNPPKSTK